MAFELAKNRINLLDIKKFDETRYAVAFEYQYINKDKSRVWQKDIILIDNEILPELNGTVAQKLVEYVNQARAELES